MSDKELAIGLSQVSLEVQQSESLEETAEGMPDATDFADFMIDEDDTEIEEEYTLHRQEELWKVHPNILSQEEPPEADVVADSEGKKMSKEEWAAFRDHEFLQTLLNLDDPRVSPKMLEFLMKNSVSEKLVSYISRVPEGTHSTMPADSDEEDDHQVRSRSVTAGSVDSALTAQDAELDTAARLSRSNADEEAVKRSFKVMHLLTSMPITNSSDGTPTIPAESFQLLRKRAKGIFRLLFDSFRKDSNANLYHVCAVFQHLFEYHTDQIVELLSSNFRAMKQYLGDLISAIDCAPVADFLVLLLLPSAATSFEDQQTPGRCHPSLLFQYNRCLSKWKIVHVIAQRVFETEKYSDEIGEAAMVVLEQLLQKLKTNQNGELLLQPIGHCPELIQGLAKTAFAGRKSGVSPARRNMALNSLYSIVCCAAEDVVMVGNGQQQPVPVKSQFASLTDKIGDVLSGVSPLLFDAIMACNNTGQRAEGRKHSAYTVPIAFSFHRLLLVRTLSKIVQHRPSAMLPAVPGSVWKVLVNWMVQFPEANMYHVAFVDLFSCLLMADGASSPAVPVVLQKCKAITVFCDACGSGAKELCSVKGPLLKCLNILRLQTDAQPVTHFLRQFLKSHSTWRGFLPTLREETQKLTRQWNRGNTYDAGNGKRLPFGTRPKNIHGAYGEDGDVFGLEDSRESQGSPFFSLHVRKGAEAKGDDVIVFPSDEEGIDLGSPYANSLGFEGVVQIDEDDGASGFGENSQGPPSGSKKKKKKKKKKRAST